MKTIIIKILIASSLLFCLMPQAFAQGTWELVYEDLEGTLGDLTFVDEWEGWVVDHGFYNNGRIYHTIDGGFSWDIQDDPTNEPLYTIFFVDNGNGWTGGYDGDIMHTENSGDEWVIQESNVDYPVRELFFLNTDMGWAVGGDLGPVNYYYIIATEDGGETWVTQMQGSTSETNTFRCVAFADSYIGIAGGWQNQIHRTDNGGEEWIPIQIDSINVMHDVSYLGNGVFCGVGHYYGALTTPVSVKSYDYGLTWYRTVLDTIVYNVGLRGVSFTDSIRGLVISSYGRAYYTNNGGELWNFMGQISPVSLRSVSYPKPYVGWANNISGNIYRYMDISITPPDSIIDLQISIIEDDIQLAWSPVEEDIFGNPISGCEYHIYRDVEPYFTPDVSNLYTVVADTFFVDIEAVSLGRRYYRVVVVND